MDPVSSRWPRDLALIIGIVAGYIGFKSNYEKGSSSWIGWNDYQRCRKRCWPFKKEVLLEAKEDNHKYQKEVENELKIDEWSTSSRKRMIQREKHLDRRWN